MRWRLGLSLFLMGLGLGLLIAALFTPAPLHSQAGFSENQVVYLLRSIDNRLQNIERRLERVESNTDRLYRRFDSVTDWRAVRVRPVQ